MNRRTLTRSEAHDVVTMAADEGLDDLRVLSTAWIGHDNAGRDADDLEALLHEYVGERVLNCDQERSNGPRYSDPTDLFNPWEES